MKDKIKAVIKSIVMSKPMRFIIIFLCILLMLAACFYSIKYDDGVFTEDEKGNPTSYTESVVTPSSTSTDGLKIDRNKIIKDGLDSSYYTDDKIADMKDEDIINKFKISKKLNRKVNSLDEISDAELLWCTNDVYSKYLDKPEELERMLNAEIITQYPDLGQEDGKLDGIIKFQRHKKDGSSEFLTYVDTNTFSKYVNDNDTTALKYFSLDDSGNVVIATVNTTTETLTSNDDEANIGDIAPSLSEDNKIEEGNYKKVTQTVSKQTINYKNYVKNYTMPFKYLWSLLVISEDKDFILDLVNLVENSEIIISVYDNITTNTNTDEYIYNKETRTDTYVELSISNTYGLKNVPSKGYWMLPEKIGELKPKSYDKKGAPDYSTDEIEYKINHTIITETNRPIFALTKANVWIADYSLEYDYQESAVTSNDSNTKPLDDTDYILDNENSNNSNNNKSLLNNEHAKELKDEAREYIEKNKPKTSVTTTDKEKANKSSSVFDDAVKESSIVTNGISGHLGTNSSKKDISSSIEDTTEKILDITASYVSCDIYKHNINRKQTTTNTVAEQKYVGQTPVNNPKVEKNADTDNFVKILCEKSHKKAKKFLTDGSTTSWLWEILEKNVPDMIDLTKYLFYKATGKNFGVDTYVFSEYEGGEFSSVGSIGGSMSLTTPVLSKEDFISAMTAYSGKISGTKKSNFDTNFLPYIGDIYDWSLEYGVNPELVIITAATEQAFKAGGGSYNYWGIAVTNGSSTGSSFSSLKDRN